MRALIQRVKSAECAVEGQVISKISKGLLVFVGFCLTDTKENVSKMCSKLKKLRIFADNFGKTNLSLKEVGAELMVISQFTLYADANNTNRPLFTNALGFKEAEKLYLETLNNLSQDFNTQAGSFGADMQITLTNSGPFTLLLEN